MNNMDDINNIYENFSNIISEVFAVTAAKRRMQKGEELTEEEKNKLLQAIYASARKNLKTFKGNKAGARIGITAVSIFFRLSGKKGKGVAEATKAIGIGFGRYTANQRALINGVSITSENPVAENFTTLLAQYEATDKYEKFMIDLVDEFEERIQSHKRDYASPIGEELQQGMKDTREEVVTLSKRYVKINQE